MAARLVLGLAALTTLLTSTPHFHCLCPNGRVKPFCLSLFAATCCCADFCCEAAAAAPGSTAAKKACCCLASPRLPGKHQLNSTGCSKTIVAGKPAFAPSVQQVAADLQVVALVAIVETAPHGTPCFSGQGCHFQPGPWPPPTDLVTVLEHFLI